MQSVRAASARSTASMKCAERILCRSKIIPRPRSFRYLSSISRERSGCQGQVTVRCQKCHGDVTERDLQKPACRLAFAMDVAKAGRVDKLDPVYRP